jgi:hypothetical protein
MSQTGRLATDANGIAREFILLRWNIAGSEYGENSSSISIATGTYLSSQGRGLWLAQSLAGIPQRL